MKAQRDHYDSLALAQRPVSQEAWIELATKEVKLQEAYSVLSKQFLAAKPARARNPMEAEVAIEDDL